MNHWDSPRLSSSIIPPKIVKTAIHPPKPYTTTIKTSTTTLHHHRSSPIPTGKNHRNHHFTSSSSQKNNLFFFFSVATNYILAVGHTKYTHISKHPTFHHPTRTFHRPPSTFHHPVRNHPKHIQIIKIHRKKRIFDHHPSSLLKSIRPS